MQGYKRPLAIGIQELIWRKGEERCERSTREPGTREPGTREPGTREPGAGEQPVAVELLRDTMSLDGFRPISSKREEVNTKMNERYLVGQATQNPFMASNNYANDIEDQMNFLTPQKS